MSDATYELLAGRYELHRQLATGGSADVFLARDQLLNRPVAVKVLSEQLAEDDDFVERLRREAQLVASLNHQNIVGVFDQGEQEGAPFIVMEYVEGRSLADILRTEGRLHPDRAATIAVDVAAALDAAHRQGMVHMDVKPGNVLITPDGQVKLADFGIAKAMVEGHETDYTAVEGQVMGTATYLSPEQAQGQKVGPRSDVYSLAVVLYEMMTGRPPFIGDAPGEIARKHVHEAPVPPRKLGVTIAQSLEAITLKGLAKSPVNRYPSVRDFAADLKRYLGGAHNLNGSAAHQAPTQTQRLEARPVTGRSTAPDVVDDATVVLPAAEVARSHAPVARPQPESVPHRGAAASAPQVLRAEPVRQEPAPVVHRSDDTWKRNVLFFLALMILSVLLGFLATAFLDVLRGDDSDVAVEADPTVETVELANYFGFERDQAIRLLETAGLTPIVEFEESSDVEEGRVFRQDPPAGRRVEAGSEVTIVVSQQSGIEVPLVIELTREEAVRQLTRLGFEPQVVEADNEDFGPGEVFGQTPLAGETAGRGSVVVIDVSLGKSERTVPDLAGKNINVALNELIGLEFKFQRFDEPDPEVEIDVVLRTEPEGGALLRGGETVTIYVSSGVAKKTVPDVTGLLADSARQQLISDGFEVAVEFEPTDDPNKVNVVIAQSPDANIEVDEGSAVRLVVGQEPPPEETTTTTTVADTTTTTAAPTTTTTTTTEAP